ncbi:MAG: hypothetical protein U5K54_24070 [Cytophagales bacterium]|nr:hypothetical protein [Cytophagales bacterium]
MIGRKIEIRQAIVVKITNDLLTPYQKYSIAPIVFMSSESESSILESNGRM